MKIERINAYKVLEDRIAPGTNERMIRLEHRKTGAQLVVVPNKDKKRVFVIGFRTPPYDSTGAAHIVEHCVLDGSKKYPVKDLFKELNKKSYASYMNAGTTVRSIFLRIRI